MPIEAVKIPQNVYIEDRIVGPLTLKQILIVGVGGGFSYAMFALLSKAYGAVPLPVMVMIWIPAVISAAFAFIKINDLSMLQLLLLTIERMNKPQIRTWSPRRGVIINIRTYAAPDQKEAKPTVVHKEVGKLTELSSMLDQPVMEMPEDEAPAPAPAQTASAETAHEELPASVRPVNPLRVKVSSLTGTNEPASAPSLMRDISPAPDHV